MTKVLNSGQPGCALNTWVEADAQESQEVSLSVGSAQALTMSGLQTVLETDQYTDSGIAVSVLRTHGGVTQSTA